MNKALKWIGGGILVLGALSALTGRSNHPGESAKPVAVSATQIAAPASPPPPQFNPQTIRLVKDLVVEDLKTWSTGGEAAFDDWHVQNMGAPIKVTAVDLSRKYNANEVAADNEYKGKTLWITGKVDAISKNAFNQPYLALRGAEMFHEVQASMDKSAYDQIATFSKGQKVSLICRGSGMVLMSPMATQCITLNTALDQVELKEANWVDSFFAGNGDGSDGLKSGVAMTYLMAASLPADSPCHKSIGNACQQDLKRITITKAEMKSRYDEMQAYLKLPTWQSPVMKK
jgi:tRNA_anti-like